ncbi:hypothetical protein EDD15DRAFT_2363365 [Pisolithus albus]|nr:hypothetical protein EDD15DRAFT_2363365 [Pisolithus albus]
MPTQSLTAALLVLGNTEGLPWSTPPWEAITHVHGLPWSTVEGASDDSPAPYVSGWTTRLASKVKAFAEKVWTLKKPDAQDSFVSTRKADNHSSGREAWSKFVRDNQGKWGINRIIDDVLFNAGRAPQQVMRDLDVQKLPSMEDAQIQDCLKPLAERLLGLASYVGTTSLLKQEVARFKVWGWTRLLHGRAFWTRSLDTPPHSHGSAPHIWMVAPHSHGSAPI